MSVIASLFAVDQHGLESYTKNPVEWNESSFDNLFLDSFFYDLYELSAYYGDDSLSMKKLITGCNKFDIDEFYDGYSTNEEVKSLCSFALGLGANSFKEAMQQAISDNNDYLSPKSRDVEMQDYLEGLLSKIISFYEKAVANNHSVIVSIG